jgi:hypothetical protein
MFVANERAAAASPRFSATPAIAGGFGIAVGFQDPDVLLSSCAQGDLFFFSPSFSLMRPSWTMFDVRGWPSCALLMTCWFQGVAALACVVAQNWVFSETIASGREQVGCGVAWLKDDCAVAK